VNGGAGKKANLDIVGGGEGSVAGGRGHGWGADLANGTERCFDSRGTTAALLPFTEACAWRHLAVLLHAPRGEREAADEQWLRRWRRTPAHARAPARGGQGRAAAPAVVEEEPPGDLRRRRGGSEGREEREGVSVGGERGGVES